MADEISLIKRIFQKDEITAVTTITTEGIIATWNPMAEKVFSHSADEVIGKSVDELTPAPLRNAFKEVLAKVQRNEQVGFYVISLTREKEGANLLVRIVIDAYPVENESGRLIAVAMLCHDVTEQDQSINLFNVLANSSPVGIYIVQKGKFRYVTPQFAAILGYTQEELLNTESLNYVYSEDREKVRANAVAALKSGNYEHKPYEFRIKTKGGDLKWIKETIVPILFEDRKATLGNFTDVTEEKKIQAEMQQANKKLAAVVSRLEARNRNNTIITEMRDLLQSCSSTNEIAPIITMSVQKLFPDTDGALFLMSPSRTELELAGRWGNFSQDVDDNVFSPNDCWGLRQGKAHIVENAEIGLICPHLKHMAKAAYMCLPLTAKGDVLGLLHLRMRETMIGDGQDIKNAATAFTGVLSLAIANVKLEESLIMQSIIDPLSGLFNRRYMEETFQREIIRAMRKDSQIGIIMADIDHFKNFNDTYGHAAGDKMIVDISSLLKGKTRGSDIVCRYGGEEFVLILPDSPLEDSYNRAEYLRQEVKKLSVVFQNQLLNSVTISMGVVAFPTHGKNTDALLKAADIALYKAKKQGRDRVITG